MTKHLQRTGPERIKRRPKGWSPERRARQAVLIRGWQPWRRSTGPKTEAGKTRCAMNALKHGHRSQATIREFQRIRYALRLAAKNIEAVKLFIRLREASARPRIKYKGWYASAALANAQVQDRGGQLSNPPPSLSADLSAEAQRAKTEARRAKADRACLADVSAEARRAKAEAATCPPKLEERRRKQRRQVGGFRCVPLSVRRDFFSRRPQARSDRC